MMYLWIVYVTIATLLLINSNDFWFSISAAALLLLVLWPLALPIMFVCEIFKAINEK